MWIKLQAPHRTGPINQGPERPTPPCLPLLEHITEGVAVLDPQGVLRWGNARLWELLGRPPEDVLGTDFTQCFDEATRQVVQEHWRATRQGPGELFEVSEATPTGGLRPLQLTMRFLPGEGAGLEGTVAIITEATALRHVEPQLPKALPKHHQLAEFLDVVFWEADPQTFNFLFISDHVEHLLGFPPHRFYHQPDFWVSIIHPEDRPRVLENYKKVIRELTSHSLEYRVFHADGRVVWLEQRTSVRSENDRPTGLCGMWREVTGRKVAEEQARLAARYNELLLACVGEGICAVDPQGLITFINPAGAALLGYEPKNLLGQNFHNSIHYQHTDGSPYPAEACPVLSVLRGARQVEVVDTYFRADGTPLPVEVVAHAVTAEGRLDGAVITFRDISDRLRADGERQSKLALLRASADIFRSLLAEPDPALAAPTVVSLLGQAAGVDRCYWFQVEPADQGPLAVICRAEWCRTGVPAHANHPAFRNPPADPLQRLRSALRQGESFAAQWSQLSQEEQEFFGIFGPKSFVVFPVFFDGVFSGFLGFDRLDPEHRWSAEELDFLRLGSHAFGLALERHQGARQRAELAGAVEQLGEGLAIVDLPGRVLYSNPAIRQLVGAPIQHLEQICPVLARPQGEVVRADYLWDHLRSGVRFKETLLLHTADGVKEVETTLSPLYDSSGQLYRGCLTMVDISPRLQLERQFLRAQKMEALGQFAASIAHDFNNLLMVIGTSTDLAQQHLASGTELQEELLTIRTSVTRAAELTGRLLAFSRRQILDRKPINLTSLVGGMMPLLRRVLSETITLSFIPNATETWALADSGQLEHVLMNLVVNARDAMPRGGFLTISTGGGQVGEEYRATHPWALPGEYSWFAVADTGVGMDENTLSRIFEPFFSTKQPGRGTGLGLSTVYGIVKQHGGFIDVVSRPDEGSTFTVYLPATPSPQPGSTTAKPHAHALRGENEHILVVEDHDELRRVLARLLADHGYRVSQARDGADALQLIHRFGSDIALVISDVVMPKMGGFELFRHVRMHYPRLPFLFSSGYADAQPEEMMQGALVSYITKPYTIETLLTTIRQFLVQNAPLRVLPDPAGDPCND